MPFTPFHFGPGLFLKWLLAPRFSFIAFVAVQVVIDFESLYNLLYQRYPVHRFFHTYLGSTIVAAVVAVLVYGGLRLFEGTTRRLGERWLRLLGAGRPALVIVLASCLIGGWSHVALDSLMHVDMTPLAPYMTGNAALGILSIPVLHLLCLGFGVAAIFFMAVDFLYR